MCLCYISRELSYKQSPKVTQTNKNNTYSRTCILYREQKNHCSYFQNSDHTLMEFKKRHFGPQMVTLGFKTCKYKLGQVSLKQWTPETETLLQSNSKSRSIKYSVVEPEMIGAGLFEYRANFKVAKWLHLKYFNNSNC